MNRNETFLNNKNKRFLFTALAFLLIHAVGFMIDPYARFWEEYFNRPWTNIVVDWIGSLIVCFLVSESSIRINDLLNIRLPWTGHTGRRLALETLLNLLMVLVINLVYFLLHFLLYDDPNLQYLISEEEFTRSILQWALVSVMTAFVIMAINIGDHLVVNWKNEAMRAAALSHLAMEAELQALKLQIDPHFVFNNLSVLSELILEDQQLGYEYAENFSKIYRYMLVNSKKDTISLDEELRFLRSYVFLIKHRMGEGVVFTIDVALACQALLLPPLTLQLLVENALKHNRTSKKTPLNIRIYTDSNNNLIIRNDYLPLEKRHASSGIGIKNIIRRYDLLSSKSPVITHTESSFEVIIPLITP